ncbi:MAG: hypothetical protein AB1757_25530 [Acidobacteriota bacterium]
MMLSLNGKQYKDVSREFLHRSLSLMSDEEFCEIWITAPEGMSLCCLKNKHKCFLMYLRFEGDSGFTIRNQRTSESELMKFVLSNGQVDFYPSSWTTSYETGKNALEYFYSTKAMDTRLRWNKD